MVILNESKKIKNLELYKRNAIILASLLGITGMTQAAECDGVINSYTRPSNGTACTVSGSNYDYIHAANPGTIITVTNPVSVVSSSSATAAVIASNGSSINFMGDTTVSAIGQRHGVYIIEGSNVIINGNLNSTPSGKNARAIHIDGQGSSLIVNGDLTGTRIGNIGGAVVELTGGNSITVGGATHLIGNSTDGLRNAGTAVFSEDVIIDANNYAQGILNKGTIMANGNMNINATNMSNGGLINQSGVITIKKDLTIVNDTTAAVNTSGISISGGKVSVEGNTKVDVTGTTTNNMSNAYAAGIRVTGVNSIFESLGTNNTITTTGMNAHGLYITNGTIALGRTAPTTATGATILLESGTVTTSGAGAHAVYANNATGNITITEGTAGVIKTTGATADGIEVVNNGTGKTIVTTSGTIATTGIGINTTNNSTAGDTTVSQTAGTITGSSGIHTSNSGVGNTTINTSGRVTGTSGFGISAVTSGSATGNTDITNTGTVSGATLGINAGTIGGSGNIKVTNTGTVSGGSGGIVTSQSGTGNTEAIIDGTVTGTNTTSDGVENIISGTSSTGNITVTQNSGTITGGTNGINSLNDGTGSTNITVAGVVTGGTGVGINTSDSDTISSTTDNFATVTLNSGAVVSSTSGIAIQNDEGDSLTTVNSGAAIQGKVILGDGNDNLVINGTANISGATLLDGGDAANSVDLLGSTTYTNKLTFNGTTQSIAGSTMVDWQTVTLDKSNVTFINDAALVTGVGTNSDGSLQGLVLTNASTLTSPIALGIIGDVNIDSTSTLSHALGGSITGNVTNAGMINWQNLGQQLIISGNYIGNAGNMSLGTDLGDDNSVTDQLVINGNTSGTTTVTVRPKGTSAGAQTVEGIKIIDIENGTSGATFTLASAVQAGAYEYTLFKNGVSTPTDGDWYLRSTLIPTPTEPATPIYRPGTSNYVSAQTANAEQGFAALGTLHERMNEQQVVSTDKQTWVRYYGNTESNNGDSRFNYNQHISAVQVGQDLYNKTTDNGTDVHSGIMFDYSNSEVDFADRVREDALLDNTTGNLEARSYGIGGYYTAINGDESYLDVVGMVSKLDNKFEDSYGMKSTQDGYRLGLSVEAGKKLAELGKWKVEGQGQLAYQYTNYDNFNDDISGIDGYGASTLRGRLGVRVYRHLESTKEMKQIDNAQVYGVANVIQDFINPTDVAVGGTNVSEKFDKTTLEVGGGFQVPVTGTTYVYTDARYDRSIKGNKEQGKLTIGFKTQF